MLAPLAWRVPGRRSKPRAGSRSRRRGCRSSGARSGLDSAAGLVPAIVNGIAIAFFASGFFMLQPNEAGVITLFGDYLGTERKPGLRWTWPG